MAEVEFPKRLFTLGQEPHPIKSITYYSNDTKLFTALKKALSADEWDELKNSRLGVFLRFHEMDFGWASRLVHFMLCYQIECKKKFEIWSLAGVQPVRFSLLEFERITGLNCEYVQHLENPVVEVTDDMKAFWEKMEVNFERGPSIEELTEACEKCSTWSRDDRLRLGYLAIYSGFIEAPRTSSPTKASLARLVMDLDAFEAYPWGRVAFKFLMESVKRENLNLTKSYALEGFVEVLQVWIYHALPEFAAGFAEPLEGDHSPPLLAYGGSRGRKNVKENISKQTRVQNFVVKDFSEMFPLWDGDVDDRKTDNIIKVMFEGGWTWAETHWPVAGVKKWTNVKVEYQPVKTSAGEGSSKKKLKGKKARSKSPSPTESDEDSHQPSKKARVSPGLDVEKMKAEIEKWLTGLTSNMVEGMKRFESQMNTQSQMIESIAKQLGAVEKLVRKGQKEDHTKADSSGDSSKEDKAEESKAEGSKAVDNEESVDEESDAEGSKAVDNEESVDEESEAEESVAEETAKVPAKARPSKAKAGPSKAKAATAKARPSKAKAATAKAGTSKAKATAKATKATKATGSESVNGGVEQSSVLIVDKAQSHIDYGSVKKQKQFGKVRAARIVARAKSERQRRLAATQKSPFQGNSTAKVIIPNSMAKVIITNSTAKEDIIPNTPKKDITSNTPKRGQGYYPFTGVEKEKLSVLIDWLKLDPNWRLKKSGSSSSWYYTLLTAKEWLTDTHLDAGINLLRLRYTKHPEWFRSDRICLLDSLFCQVWSAKYLDFLDSISNDDDGVSAQLPPGALDYYTGEEPAYCRSDKTWVVEIDDIYAPLFVKNNHWVACWISIPRRHIVIWDSDVYYASDEEIAVVVKPIAHMLPYMLHMLSRGEERELYKVEFTHERVRAGVPQNQQSGDCGVYCLKYIECHALGMTFPFGDFCDKMIKTIRAKLAAEIFDETSINGTEKREYKHLDIYD